MTSSIKHISVLLYAVLLISSCQFDEENLPQNEIITADLSELLPVAITQSAYNQSAIGGRGSAIFVQILAEGQDMSIRPFSSYQLFPRHFNALWDNGLFSGSLVHAITIQNQANEEAEPQYEAIAKILLACEFGTATSAFGDIPFSEALMGTASLKPVFNRQADVYAGIQSLLDEAIELIEIGKGRRPTEDDLLYSGNMELWKKFAYGLKARYLLQTSKRHPENFEAILNISHGQSFASLSEQSDFDWSLAIGAENPLYSFGVERPHSVNIDEDFANVLLDNADPRTDKIMSEKVNGSWQYFEEGNTNLHWAQSTSVIPFLSYVEIKFMETEALVKTNAAINLISASLYEAIEASFIQMGINPQEHAGFISAHADLNDLSDEEEIMQHIIEEAYVAYYGFAFRQAWCNYRRTAYPLLIPKGFETEYNPSGIIPRRFLYPQTERDYNALNTQESIDRQNGAKLDIPVWAFE